MRKIGGGSTAACARLVRANKMVGPSGAATGRGAFNLSSSIGGGRKPPLMETLLYKNLFKNE
ncbi:hypothetical protein [Rummeliibacillus sp. SL167]|uniref:hypothetical protein n=1 Tax=Rummeliibacillus sp. SL167 TaxID=2579792 RepID=UPI0011B82EA5|nr:hypothetical protein [Rummeliibacillus sp. SL167]